MYSPKIKSKIIERLYPIGKQLKIPLTRVVELLLLDNLERINISVRMNGNNSKSLEKEIPFWVREELKSYMTKKAKINNYLIMWYRRFSVLRMNIDLSNEVAERRALRDVITTLEDVNND